MYTVSVEPVVTYENTAATLAAERQLRRKLERAAESTLRIQHADTPEEVAQAICDAAVEAFEATAAGLWRLHEHEVELVWRSPAASHTPLGIRLPIAWMPSLAAQLTAGVPVMIADLEHDEPELWQRMRRSEDPSRSQLRLPFATGQGQPAVLGLSISWRQRQPEVTPADLALSRRFADQASVAMAHALRGETERDARELYEQLEASLLPRLDIEDTRVRIATRSDAAERRMRLGGDFHDAVVLEDGSLAILIGDVAGHDPIAAALGADLRASWRALTLSGLPPAQVVAAMQRSAQRRMDRVERMATLCTCHITGNRAIVVLAGHPPPVLVDGDGGMRPLPVSPGLPLGAMENAAWATQPVWLGAGWRLLLYTDGLVEGHAAPDSSERYGHERLHRRLAELVGAGHGDGAILDGLIADARASHGGRLPDDVTLLLATS